MNDTERYFATDERGAVQGEGHVTNEVDSVARRRALLKGMSAGAAIAAAAVPFKALATGGRKHCFHKDTPHRKVKASVSGMHSAISSHMAGDWPESPGKHCSHYQSRDNWPSDSSGKYCLGWNGQRYGRSALYKTVFNCSGGGYNDYTIRDIMNGQIDCPQRHWITACLNATKFGSQFSYTPHDVVTLHSDPRTNLDALYFFKYHQENQT